MDTCPEHPEAFVTEGGSCEECGLVLCPIELCYDDDDALEFVRQGSDIPALAVSKVHEMIELLGGHASLPQSIIELATHIFMETGSRLTKFQISLPARERKAYNMDILKAKGALYVACQLAKVPRLLWEINVLAGYHRVKDVRDVVHRMGLHVVSVKPVQLIRRFTAVLGTTYAVEKKAKRLAIEYALSMCGSAPETVAALAILKAGEETKTPILKAHLCEISGVSLAVLGRAQYKKSEQDKKEC